MEEEMFGAPQKKSILPLTIAISFLAALLAGGATYAALSMQSKTQKDDLQSQIDGLKQSISAASPTPSADATATPAATPTATPTPSPVSNSATIKSYSSTTLGISLEYATSLTLSTEQSGSKTLLTFKKGDVTVAMLSVGPTASSGETLAQFVSSLKTDGVLASEQAITVGGKDGYEGIDQGIISQYGMYAVASGHEYMFRFVTNGSDSLTSMKGALSPEQKAMITSFTIL